MKMLPAELYWQFIKVDSDRTFLGTVFAQGVVGILGMDIVVGSLFIFLFTFMIFMEDSPQAETAEGDDRREYNY